MLRAFLDGLDDRTGYRKLLDEALNEPIPGGASWAYVLGSATLLLFFVQFGTGLVLAVYYSPSSTDAWASVAFIEQAIPMGSFVRGLHHHAAAGMVVMTVLHMLQVFFYGAYKAPKEGNWITGLMLFGLVLAFALTGYLLPWDQTGYWATKVATSIAGTVPLVGTPLQAITQGGNDYGNLTLTRFYTLHVVLLPVLTLGLLGAHMYLFRRHGVTPSAKKTEQELAHTEMFWPKQVLYDAVFTVLVLGVLGFLAYRLGAPLQAPADPSSNFIARPEWYFLFLFQLLKYFEGPLQVVGTVIIPGGVALFLLALPFLDRSPSRRIGQRTPYVAAMALGLFAVVALTLLAIRHDANDPTIAEQQEISSREASRALALAVSGVPPEGAGYMMAHDPLTRGARVFRSKCASCHALEGEVPEEPKGPDLTAYLSRAWIRQVIRDPDSPRMFGHTKIEGMDSYADIPEDELNRLVEFTYRLREPDPEDPYEREDYALWEKHDCSGCHELEEYYGLSGPAMFRYGTAEWIRKMVDNPEDPAFYGEANQMPIFEERLPEEDRAAVVVFLQSLPERADTSKWPYVDDPGPVPSPRTKTSTAAAD